MVEIADIFLRYGPQYRAKFGDKMLPSHKKAMHAIEQCRTSALGGHVYHCPECKEKEYQYHSCRNRHCPKCQNDKAYEWLEKQQSILLPVPYFLVTFTLPDELRDVARSNQKLVYDVLFRMSAQAMQKLGGDPRFVGGQMGMVGVLHTWGRNLSYHPHIHYLVPGGGIDKSSKTWLPAGKTFLFPVKALSRLFRAKFRDALKETDCFADIPAEVWEKEWVVHSKPVGDGTKALKYLAPYIFRVAISNHRILDMKDGKVTFRYRATETGKLKTCSLPAEEFIRRFLQHVLHLSCTGQVQGPRALLKYATMVSWLLVVVRGWLPCANNLLLPPPSRIPTVIARTSRATIRTRQTAKMSCAPRVGGR